MEVDKLIKDESRETDTRDKGVTDVRIGGINERLALEIAAQAVHIWHDTSCSIEEAVTISNRLYQEGKIYEVL